MLREVVRSVSVLAVLIFLISPVQSKPYQPADINELVKMFSEICLDSFPNSDRINSSLSRMSSIKMPPSEVQRYLKTDPGQGWYVKNRSTLYAVTIEEPPYHTCAIRRMTSVGPNAAGVSSAVHLIKSYATKIGGSTQAIPHKEVQGLAGLDIAYSGIGIFANGKLSDVFAIITTNYHGRISEPWVTAETVGEGVEIRLTRTVKDR